MRLRNRFALVGFGILIFLVITPILIIYAGGFRVDWENHKLIKTGALVVKSQPTKSDIFLNEEKQEADTPANLRFLTPGDYDVRIAKDGYQSWTKRLNIKSQLVTWANSDRQYIALFLNQPIENEKWQTTKNTISRSGDEIIFMTPDTVGVIDVDRGEVSNQISVPKLSLPILNSNLQTAWADANKILSLLQGPIDWNITASQIEKTTQIETDGEHVVLSLDSNLYSFDNGSLNLIDKSILGFTLGDDGIWYIQKNQIKHYDYSNPTAEIIFSALPETKTVSILRTENQIYLNLDQTLYLLSDELEKIYSPVNSMHWDDVSNELVYANTNEIYIYNPNTRDSDLVLRSRTPIANPILNIETGYVFFQNENKIKVAELDARDHRNIYTIADAMDSFTLSADGKKLFTISPTQIKYYTIR